MAFKIGHPKYASKGDFKKGHLTWNANTSVWIEVKCLVCGSIFKVRELQFKRGRGKYCSKGCFVESLKGKIRLDRRQGSIKVCHQCNKSFEIRPCEGYREFCSKDCVNKFRTGKKRIPFTEDHKRKIGEANKLVPHPHGKDHSRWKGGITPFYNELRTLDEYKEWRMNCFERNWFKCKKCSSKENLEVHHIVSLQKLTNEFFAQSIQDQMPI